MSLHLLGDRDRFAMGHELLPDPDAGSPTRRASWGRLEIWVAGRNLTRGRTVDGALHQAAEVPLWPVASWLIRQWDYLLHEERLPTALNAASATEWCAGVLRRMPADNTALDALLAARERWCERHGLAAALPGFRVPDLQIRRRGHQLELSWDDAEWRTVTGGVELVERPGAALLAVEEVATLLYEWCGALLSDVETAMSEARLDMARVLASKQAWRALADPERQVERLHIASGLDLTGAATRLRNLAGVTGGAVETTVRALLGLDGDPPAAPLFAVLPPPVLLYRSASPRLSDGDLQRLLQLGVGVASDEPPLLVHRVPLTCPAAPADTTQAGLDAALRLRDALGLAEAMPLTGDHDLEHAILPQLGVDVVDLHLDDPHVEGASVLGPGRRPTVAINLNGRSSSVRWGRRMTLAHELCHLLHDGSPEGILGIVSNPWATYAPERRANAFAAMLLAPEASIAALLPRRSETWTVGDLKHCMSHLGVGLSTLTWHLYNLDWITGAERIRWIEAVAGQ